MRERPDTSTVPKEWTVKEQIEELYTIINLVIHDTEKILEILEKNEENKK